MISRRKSLERLTKVELIQLGKKYGLTILTSNTKTGMISLIMRVTSADNLRAEVDQIIRERSK
jgi:hypothetical protein